MTSLKTRLLSFHPGKLSLNQRFRASVALATVCSVALGAWLIARNVEQLDTSRNNLAKLSAFRAAMNAANRISAERGPTNRVLGEEREGNGTSLRLLLAYRAKTDAALAEAAAMPSLTPGIPALRAALARARQEADALAAAPKSMRHADDIARVVNGMFAAYDAAQPLIDRGMAGLLDEKSDLAGRAQVLRMLSELRDYAGRLGSYLVIPMIRREPMDPEQRQAFDQMQGRVHMLWSLIAQFTASDRDPAVVCARAAVVTQFLGEGQPLMMETLAASTTGRYPLSVTEFTATLVPSFSPLEQLRDAFMASTMAELNAKAEEAQRSLIAVTAVTLFALALELSLLLAAQELLFRPLLAARKRIVQLAEGEIGEIIDRPRFSGEIRELYRALDRLRGKLVEREMLDKERTALTQRLKRQAETDGLTGALNRRKMDELGERLSKTEDRAKRVRLILLDIDHFKRVNDTFGHGAGDDVLKEVTRRLRDSLRDGDVLARFGGEEFAILVGGQGSQATDIAERLRQALRGLPFRLAGDQSLWVTASFGSASIEPGPGAWSRLVTAADRALYQAKEAGRDCVVSRDIA